jgi:cobalamin biosynthesis protein CbiD
MVVQVLAANSGSGIGVGVVAPAEDPGVRDVARQEIAEPVDTVARGPGLVAVAIEAMDGDDTT